MGLRSRAGIYVTPIGVGDDERVGDACCWWGKTVVGVRSYVEPVRSRRCAQTPLPHHGYRIWVRYDDYLLRLTGGNRYPWWGDGGGYALTLSRSVVEGAPSHPYPTMGTASECGVTFLRRNDDVGTDRVFSDEE